jgi:TonB-linked SusC/RagA family outer membrane protein
MSRNLLISLYQRISFEKWKTLRPFTPLLFSLAIFVGIALPTNPLMAQKTITGVVYDADNITLPGVHILELGTINGTVTNLDGFFELTLKSDDAVLEFSYIGFEKRDIRVGARDTLVVSMQESSNMLDEVVVTALGIEKVRKSLGYASQIVEGADLSQAREVSVMNALSGRVAGVQINRSGTGPGGTSKVVIRGYASIGGSNTPLYVVDGMPMNNPQGGGGQFGGVDYGDGISNLNADDVASITVLKGASATSLYGSRGANGVVMITTRKGSARRGIGVDLTSSVTFETPLVLPELQNRFGRGSNGQFPLDSNGEILDGIRTSWGARTLGQTDFNGRPIVNWTGQPSAYEAQPNNFQDFFRTGATSQQTLAFSGGDQKTQFRLSLSDMRSQNIMPNSELERFSVNLNVNSQLSDKLKVSGKINFVRQSAFNRPNLTLSPDNPVNALLQMPRNVRLQDLEDFRNPDGSVRVWTNATGNDQWNNPYWATGLNTNEDQRDRVLGFVMAEYQFNDKWKLHMRSGTDFYYDQRQNRSATGTIYRVTPDRSFYSTVDSRVEERNTDFLLSLRQQLTADVKVQASVGANQLTIRSNSLNTVAQGLNIPDFFVIQNALSVQSSEAIANKEIQSVYATSQFDFRDQLFVEISARNDWSSALPANNRSFFYPAISTSWVFNELFENNKWGPLTYGKIRASIAQVGNDTGPHQLDLLYSVNALNHGGQTFGQIIPNQPPVDLKPELTTSYEGGFDVEFFYNRLSLDVTVYHAGTRNQILNVPVSRASGFATSRVNAGLVVNRGVEVALKATPIRTKDFGYDTFINFTRNRSFVEELAPNVESYQLGGTYDQFGVRILAEIGRPFGDIYADRSFLRNENGDIVVGTNGLPMPDPNGRKRIGNFQPDWMVGFGHNFRYKNITLGALFDIRRGGDIFSFTNAVLAASGNAEFTENDRLEWYAGAGGYLVDGVLEDGRENFIEVNPQTYWQYVGGRASAFAEEFIYDGSFVKLRELTIGWILPTRILETTPFTKASFNVVGRNLFILHKNTIGFDPEATFNAGQDQGIEAFAFPSTRSFGFNLNVSF